MDRGWSDGSEVTSLAVLTEDPGSVLSTHTAAQSSVTPIPGDPPPPLTSEVAGNTCGAQPDLQAEFSNA